MIQKFCRELLWQFGHGDTFFMENVLPGVYNSRVNYNKIHKMSTVSEETLEIMARAILDLGSEEDIYGICELEREVDELS